jgi:outer membrane protein
LQLEKADVEIPSAKYAGSVADVYQTSLQNLALIKANDLKIKSAEKGIKISKSGFYPALGLGGNLGSSYSSLAETLLPTTITQEQTGSYVIINGNQNPVLTQQQNYSSSKTGYTRQLNNNLGTFVGINMQIPLFNSFQTKNRIKLAKINLSNTQLESDNTKLQLKQNIEQAYLNMTSSFNRYKVLSDQLNNFEESFRAAEVRFNTGVINSAEYLISKNNFDRTKISLSQSKYEYLFRTKLLDYFQGKMIEK